jgi:hypothetical protein
MAKAFRNRSDPNADELGNEIDRCAAALEAPAPAPDDGEVAFWDACVLAMLAVRDHPASAVEQADLLRTDRRARFPKGGV